jgi:ribosomal-protein-alanine N-acetyltransferase
MNAEVTYRRATLSDLRAIAAMERRYFGRHAFGAGMLLYLLLHAGEGFIVAEADREVVGYIVVRRESVRRARAELPTFAVREDLRGRGIGSALLRHALGYLERIGVRRVVLQVSVRNAGAKALYDRFGFEVGRTLPGYYGNGEDAYLMARRLGGQAPDDD